jgi:hypothetical protein
MNALYVFAIIRDTPVPFEFEGHRVEFVAVGGVAAAVERVAARPKIDEAALRIQHEIVIRIAHRVDEILPARFGAVVAGTELEQLVAMRHDVIGKALDLVRGRVQITVRMRDGIETAPRSDRPRPEAVESGTAYLEARRAASVRSPSPAAEEITAVVRHLVAADRHDRREGQATTSIYHLIGRASVDEYLRLLSSVATPGITVSGPWPPFAFAPDLWP